MNKIYPSQKSEEIEDFIKSLTGEDRRERILRQECAAPPIGCGKPFLGFKDKLSEREASISGLCQECQDSIFERKTK